MLMSSAVLAELTQQNDYFSSKSLEIQKLQEFTLTFTSETLFTLGKLRGYEDQIKT